MTTPPQVALRAPSPDDLDILFRWEQDRRPGVDSDDAPPSRFDMWCFLREYTHSLTPDGQMRFVIATDGLPVGAIDLFDHNPREHSARVGIYIAGAHRRHGLATEALIALSQVSARQLGLRVLHATVDNTNIASLRAFGSAGFEPHPHSGITHFHKKIS